MSPRTDPFPVLREPPPSDRTAEFPVWQTGDQLALLDGEGAAWDEAPAAATRLASSAAVARPDSRKRRRRPHRRHLLAALAALAVVAALAAPALAGDSPSGGVPVYNAPACGTSWVGIHIPQTSYYNVYNDDFGNETCVRAQRHHLDFQVSAVSDVGGFHAYPNISSGWESEKYTCAGRGGACFSYPVRERDDGSPLTSIAGWLAPGRYDFSYDIWFNRTNAHPLQDDGAEVMIWLAHPGVQESCGRVVRIGGIEWCVTGWETDHPGEPRWNLVIYYAVTPRSSAYGLWLNEFFKDAIAHGELSPDWYLTGIDAGFELVQGGLDDNIHFYSLTGVR